MSESKRPSNVYRRAHAIGRKPDGAGSTPRMKQIPDCDMARECGACQYINRPYMDGLRAKHELGLTVLRKAGVLGQAMVLPPVESPSPLGSRAFAKLAVRECPEWMKDKRRIISRRRVLRPMVEMEDGSFAPAPREEEGEPVERRFAIGIFKPRSHDIVDLLRCPLHATQIKNFLPDLQLALDTSELRPYDERTGKGDVRYVAIRASHLTEELMVTFVVTRPLKVELRKIVNELRAKQFSITSAHMNIQSQAGNAIFGPTTEQVAGTPRLREKLCGLELEVSPTAFFQVNPWQADNIYRRIETLAGETRSKEAAWDLYCGSGIISLILARNGYGVFGLEENPAAIEDARHNLRLNNIDSRTQFTAGLVEDLIDQPPAWAIAPKLVVVNPSRRGMADSVRLKLAGMMSRQPETRLVYMSCEVATLARDLADFANAGFRLRQIEAFDMFPQTDNLEWLAVVTK